MKKFNEENLRKLYVPPTSSNGEDNGQITIIGGSELFHGSPIFSLKAASRIVDMVFFSSPEPRMGDIASKLKSQLSSFIWVPFGEVEEYIKKSDACLIGPGFMRFRSEGSGVDFDEAGEKSKKITERILASFPDKKWVIDAGSLQVMEPEWIPEGAVLTPNKMEYARLFGDMAPNEAAEKYKCIVVLKGSVTTVCASGECFEVYGGNAGLTKGGTGDVQAGVTVGLLAKNDPLLAAASASFLTKAAADSLYKRVSTMYNADDLASEIPKMFGSNTP